MSVVGAALRSAGVAAIYLAHGTFLGSDALGLLADLARVAPSLAESLRRRNKSVLDAVAGDGGNFTRTFAEKLEQAINRSSAPSIPVRLFHWSSENHHIGRACGAISLLNELLARRFAPGSRVLLWGHSHGGNMFALLTNLLARNTEACRDFFDRSEFFYRGLVFRHADLPIWQAIRDRVCCGDEVLPGVSLDVVTMGTPVRYGWDSDGCAKLLHIIFHRSVDGLPPYQAPYPPSPDDVLHAAHGDFVQQFGVAGTNFSPPLWSWRAWQSDRRLGELLQPAISTSSLLARLRMGIRVHADGENLLVDYGPVHGHVAQHIMGHAIYTRLEWQLFHAEETARRFYGLDR